MSKIAYIIVHPPCKVLATITKYESAVDIAKSKKALLYQADTFEKDGFTYATQPWKLKENYLNFQDKTNKPDLKQEPETKQPKPPKQEPPELKQKEPEETTDIICPICNKKFKKQFGLTNHMNAIHPGNK